MVIKIQDLRSCERVHARLQLRYQAPDGWRTAFAENISQGGLFIATNDPLTIGTLTSIEIGFPDAITHRAEVMWAIRVPAHLTDAMVHGMGLQFVMIDRSWPEFFRRWKLGLHAGE